MRSAKFIATEREGRWIAGLSLVVALAIGASPATAQDEAGGDTAGAEPAPAGPMVESTPPTTTTTTAYGAAFVPAPGTDLEAHLPSSGRSKADIYEPDTFDLRRPNQATETLRGNPDALGVLRSDLAPGGGNDKGYVIVKKGDTLWGICAENFDDPRLWPRVWSYNPQLQNPHWIYPGDQLRVRPAAPEADATASSSHFIRGGTLGTGVVAPVRVVPPETVFLRDLGYIDDPEKDVWGQVVGAREEQQLLSDGNHVYMILRPGAEVKLGQLMTVFQDVRRPPDVEGARRPPGRIVAFKGTVKIDSWDPQNRVARGELVESLDVIERGAKVGPIGRRYYVVPPTSSQVDVEARVLTSLYPHAIMGRDQVVFIDRGTNDGLQAGNRLSLVRRGDAWRRTLLTTTDMARGRILMDVPERVEFETTPLHGDDETFPEEVIGELRIIHAQRYSALALVTASQLEIEPGDRAVARKGQ